VLLEEQFSVENEMLTPTMKLKRHIAKKRFAEEIERMYSEGPYLVGNMKKMKIE